MVQPYLTNEMLERLKVLPKEKRAIALKKIGQEEWNRCAEDIFYWIDASRHPIPYAYTKDPHPMYRCNICTDGEAYQGSKRKIHLNIRHNIETKNEYETKKYFKELDTIRVFTMMPYFRPIIEAWFEHPLMCIEKSRDMMATWLIVTCYAWDTLFHKGRQNIFQSENASKTQELVERAYILHKNQPKWLRDVHPADFSLGGTKAGLLKIPSLQSEILGMPQGADKIRQYHPSGFFNDEAAYDPEAGATYAAIKPAIMAGGRYTAVSSANPSYFMHLCQDTIDQAV